MDQETLEHFYRNWQENLPQLMDGYLYDQHKRLLPTRSVFADIQKVLEKFLAGTIEDHEKIMILPGIRGVGKTTLLMQLMRVEKFLSNADGARLFQNFQTLDERLYLDASRLRLENISLRDFFHYYERVKDIHLERLHKKFLLLIDEIHYDEQWGLFLKTLFDRTKGHRNLLVIATGSSAIHLKNNPDLSRRTTIEEVYPLKFDEYALLASRLGFPGEAPHVAEALFRSQSAPEAYQRLKKLLSVERFFHALTPRIEKDFFITGNFPFTIGMENGMRALELVKNVINSVIAKDILMLKKFKTQTVAKIGVLLYLVAHSDVVSYEKLRASLKIERFETLESLVEVLIMSGLMVKVPSFGKTYGTTRKTPKLLFIAPSLRAAVLDNAFPSGVEGKKLEDYFALVYHKDLRKSFSATLSYDAAEGGADFVLSMHDKRIVIEVGFQKEDVSQVRRTLTKVNGAYGMVFGSKKLELIGDSIIKIPLPYLLLI